MPGKTDASLNEKLSSVEWGEFRIGVLFEVLSSNKIFHANKVEVLSKQIKDSYPYIVRATTNNGQKGYVKAKNCETNQKNTLSFTQDTFMVFYQKDRFVTSNKIKVLNPKFTFFNCSIANFIVSVLNRVMKNLSWGTGSNIEMIKKIKFKLPVRGGKIDFDFMESFISAIQKLVIKDVVLYKDKKIESIKKIVNKQNQEKPFTK